MLYNFICPNCKSKKEVNVPSSEIKSLEVMCDDCGSKMRRDWKSAISVADGDKASDIEQTSWVKEKLKTRPSGKSQIYY